jgi:acetyl-CoA acetyltransferase
MPDQIWTRNRVAIVGVGATSQGLHPGRSSHQLGMDSFKLALDDCGLADRSCIDGLLSAKQLDGSGIDPVRFCFQAGMNPGVTGALDYGTCGFTTQYAAMLIATGTCELVACVYGRNLPGAMEVLSGAGTYDAHHGYVNAHAAFALGWSRYVAKHKPSEATLGYVLTTARRYAALNPIAAWPEEISLEEYLADDFLIWPLRSLDICRVSAGGVCLIMASERVARDLQRQPVYLHATGRQQAPRLFENEDQLLCYPMRDVAAKVYRAAGMTPQDIDVLMMSDPCTAHIVHTLENYGFCGEGEAENFLKEGNIWLDGKTPVNPNGGQLGEGYLVGWLHHVELVRQLRGECGARQIGDAKIAQYCATGRQREDYLSSIFIAD